MTTGHCGKFFLHKAMTSQRPFEWHMEDSIGYWHKPQSGKAVTIGHPVRPHRQTVGTNQSIATDHRTMSSQLVQPGLEP